MGCFLGWFALPNKKKATTAQTANWSSMLHASRYDYPTFAKEVDMVGENAKKKAGKK